MARELTRGADAKTRPRVRNCLTKGQDGGCYVSFIEPSRNRSSNALGTPFKGPLGRVLGTGIPVVESASVGLPSGYRTMVGLPVHVGGALSHIVAWYV